MVDAVKILGALLGGGGMSKGSGSNVLESMVGAALSGNSGGDLGDILGGGALSSGKVGQQSEGGGGLGDLMGDILGGASNQGGSGGGLGDLLGSGSTGGGLGNILESVLAGSTKSQGGVGGTGGGALADILGGVLSGSGGSGGIDLGDLLGAALNQFGQSQASTASNLAPRNFEQQNPGMSQNQANDQATLIIRGMINAAKSDGRLDQQEQQNITGKLGHVTQDEIDFINQELARPLDVDAFSKSIPRGMEHQVYAMSLTAIDLDTNSEAQYLHQLAQGLKIDPQTANQIHQQVGAPTLYS